MQQFQPNNSPTYTGKAEPATRKPFLLSGFFLFHYLPLLCLTALWAYVYEEYYGFFSARELTSYSWAAGVIVFAFTVQSVQIIVSKGSTKNWNLAWAIGFSFYYALGILFFFYHADSFNISDLRGWPQPMDFLIYSTSILIPAILHTITLFALQDVKKARISSPWMSLLGAFALPLGLYMIFSTGLFSSFGRHLDFYIVLILSAALTILFLYLFARAIVYWYKKKQRRQPGPTIKFIFTFILPLFCLFFNAHITGWGNGGIIGNFTHWLYFALAAVNGLVVSLPLHQWISRKISFVLRAIMLPFSLYYFIILAPLLPFALLLTIVLGLGLLLLVPSFTLGLHIQSINEDYNALKKELSGKIIASLFVVALAILPAGIHISFVYQRTMLNSALDYLSNPATTEVSFWKSGLERALIKARNSRNNNNFFFLNDRTPIIDSWYSSVALNNLELSTSIEDKIRRIFFGEPLSDTEIARNRSWFTGPDNSNVVLKTIQAESKWNEQDMYWESTIDLEMENTDEGMREYLSRFNLPAGAFISDYYLYVEGEKKQGILTERKAATWLYNQITSRRRDPGLLRYMENGELELRIFPFVGQETRKSGFTIVHPQPFTFKLDERSVALGNNNHSNNETYTAGALYISAEKTLTLEKANRKPVLHFIVDCSIATSESNFTAYKHQIENILEQYPDLKADAQILLTNYAIKEEKLSQFKWNKKDIEFEGGFYLNRAIEVIGARQYGADFYAIPVILSSKPEQAILDHSLSNIQYAFPELESIYFFNNGQVNSVSLSNTQEEGLQAKLPVNASCLKYKTKEGGIVYLKDSHEAQLIPLLGKPDWASSLNKLQAGLALWSAWQQANLGLSPEPWNQQVRNSFAQGILSPYTAFMVVEQAWQEELLQKKQEQFLSGNAALDAGDQAKEMPEPGFWLLLILVMVYAVFQYRSNLLHLFIHKFAGKA